MLGNLRARERGVKAEGVPVRHHDYIGTDVVEVEPFGAVWIWLLYADFISLIEIAPFIAVIAPAEASIAPSTLPVAVTFPPATIVDPKNQTAI